MIPLLTTGFTIPYNPFDMELLIPFFNDLVGKVSLGSTLGLMGFLAITGSKKVIGGVLL